MTDQVEKTIRRTRQYWHVDGFAEISIGLLFLVLGLIIFGQAVVPGRSAAGLALQLALPAVFLVGFVAARRVIGGLKERVTYPRTGYVAYPRPPRKLRALSAGVAMLLAVVVAGLAVRYRPIPLNWIPLVEGVFSGILLVLVGQGLRRFWVVGGLAALFGACLAFVRLDGPEDLSSAYFYGATGLALVICGAVTLWRYLRMYPIEEER